MNKRMLSELQKEFKAFFIEKMRFYGVKSPVELTKEKKSAFFSEIKQDWTKHKLSKVKLEAQATKHDQFIFAEPKEIYTDKAKKRSEIILLLTLLGTT